MVPPQRACSSTNPIFARLSHQLLPMQTRILSYNVNGIRSAISKGLIEWLLPQHFDFICIQETKAQPEQVDLSPLLDAGYKAYWHSAKKKGYSGVLTLSRREPDLVEAGCGDHRYDDEGRILRTDFGEYTLLNCYFPSGTTGDVRQEFKYRFLDDFFDWIQHLRKERPQLIVAGDFNIAHTEMDIHDPKGNKNSSGFLPEERAWMTKFFSSGFTDPFRKVHPDLVEYSWWSFRANARAKNKGWRIDYIAVSDNLADRIIDLRHLTDVVHADHCPVLLTIDL
ncbi:MAG: exodeoxyribonuclease [Saprospiraceae bacterium]|nr:MAG: exodeoxyribonuclease [Saprospiraceae bacterium]